MPDFNGTVDIVTRYVKARVPLIVIDSIEHSRVHDLLLHVASQVPSMPFFEYTRTEGLRELTRGTNVIDDHSLPSVLDHAQKTFKTRQNVNFVFSDLEDLSNDSPTSRHIAQVVRLADGHQGSLILIVDKPVWTGLSRLGMTVSLDLPTNEEMYDTVEGLIEGHRSLIQIEWQYDEMRRAAEILSGITESEAINVLATMIAKGRIYNSDLAELSQFKDAIFGELAGIERIHLQDDYEVGGLDNLKNWLRKREALIKTDLSQTKLHPPKGVLLCGVPGCGKSLSAKAIATEWGLPLYRLDMGAVMGMYVGESENNLREALATADRVAPCILWIDEIEKGLASGLADNSVTKRLIGRFLFWMQESTSKAFLVATANDVSSLPPELLRKGRFDEVFFVDLPTAAEREEILQMCFRRYTGVEIAPDLLADLVELADGFAGSDLDAAVHDIASDMLANHTTTLPDDQYIREVFTNVVPFSRANPEEVAAIQAWGADRAVPAGSSFGDPIVQRPTPTGRQVVL